MEIILGLTAAICWGVADFYARFAARRIGTYRTLMLMQAVGAAFVTVYLYASHSWPHAPLGWRPWAFAAVAGLCNVVSGLALYYSFEIGVMSVAAPISSAYPALTVTLAFFSGERITALRGAGLAVTFVGLLLAALSFAPESAGSAPSAPRPHLSRGVGWAVLSAIGYGFMFWWLGFHVVRDIGGAASVWVVRVTTLVVLALAAVPAHQSIRLPRGMVWWLLALVGVTDTVAFIANNIGLQLGHVSVVTVISSLYGAVTVLLSAIFVRERIGKSQWLGVALIFAGIVLVNL